MEKKKHALVILALALLVFTAYVNSLRNEFVWDDRQLIVQNPVVRNSGHFSEMFKANLFAGAGRGSAFYRPLQLASYRLDYLVWGLNPPGFRFTNILLHFINCSLLYFLIISLLNVTAAAFIAGAFFAVHPFFSESVTYVAGRADLLFLFFILLSLLLFLSGLRNNKFHPALLIVLSLAFYGCSLLSKEMAVIFPLLAVICGLFFRENTGKKPLRFFFISIAGYFFIAAIYISLRLTTISFAAGMPEFQTSRHGIVPMLTTYFSYPGLFFFPVTLHMERLTLPSSPFPVLISLAILVPAIIYLIIRSYGKAALFAGAWYIITLLPVSNIVGLNAAMAEHWLYLPSVGLILIITLPLADASRKNRPAPLRAAAFIVFAALLFAYTTRTIVRNRDWKNSLSIFRHTVRHSPESARALNGLGAALARADHLEESAEALRKALEINPAHIDALNNLGAVCGRLGLMEESIKYLRKSLEINPKNPDVHNNLGAAYGKAGKYTESIEEFKKTLELDSNRTGVYKNIALTYLSSGDKKKAVEYLRLYLDRARVGAEEERKVRKMIERIEEQ